MKKLTIIALVLFCGLMSGSAAFAYDWFNRWDANHDGRWNRNEFYNAQRYWGHNHGGYPVAGWGPSFVQFDHNHDRYWDRREAWRYHHW